MESHKLDNNKSLKQSPRYCDNVITKISRGSHIISFHDILFSATLSPIQNYHNHHHHHHHHHHQSPSPSPQVAGQVPLTQGQLVVFETAMDQTGKLRAQKVVLRGMVPFGVMQQAGVQQMAGQAPPQFRMQPGLQPPPVKQM
jgi:G3E family GTPase